MYYLTYTYLVFMYLVFMVFVKENFSFQRKKIIKKKRLVAPKTFCHSPVAMKRIKINLTLAPVKQRIHFAPATRFFTDKKKKQNKNACR